MPYQHSELSKDPLDVLGEETKIRFSLDKLPPAQRAAFEKMSEQVLSKKYGEPFDVADNIFR